MRHVQAALVDEAEVGQLAKLVARLTPAQQRLVVALADGFRSGRLEHHQRERAWRDRTRTTMGSSTTPGPGWRASTAGARPAPLRQLTHTGHRNGSDRSAPGSSPRRSPTGA
jgi:hypothetical protein